MDIAWTTYGHAPAKRILEKQLASGIFPHAYLFAGPEGVGKKTLALEFAQKVLEARQLSNHPDFQILEEEGQISVERVRDFIAGLGLKPFVAKRKVAIINDAQNLNPQSGNALLKTLEEPSQNTILILISSGKQLLPTIVSRCQALWFNAFTQTQLQEIGKAKGKSKNAPAAELAFGSIARLKRLEEDEGARRDLLDDINRFKSLQSGASAERLLAVSEFAERETEDLVALLKNWYFWQAGQLRQEPRGFKALQALGDALQLLQSNKNKKLVLQGLFLKI